MGIYREKPCVFSDIDEQLLEDHLFTRINFHCSIYHQAAMMGLNACMRPKLNVCGMRLVPDVAFYNEDRVIYALVWAHPTQDYPGKQEQACYKKSGLPWCTIKHEHEVQEILRWVAGLNYDQSIGEVARDRAKHTLTYSRPDLATRVADNIEAHRAAKGTSKPVHRGSVIPSDSGRTFGKFR